MSVAEAYFDGLCEPRNPGGYACGGWYAPAQAGIVGLEKDIRGHAFYGHGPESTNNVAEYRAAMGALQALYAVGYRGHVMLYGDSMLVVNQFEGAWKVNKPHIRELLGELRRAAGQFASVRLVHVPRERNAVADEESRVAYRETTGKPLAAK